MKAGISRSKEFYEFGPFRLDTEERLLLQDGAPLTLTPKAYDTLLVLVQNSGHIIDRDELMKSVWPDVIVEENNLNQNIRALRKAFGEYEFIETIPRRGYRFVGTVTEADQSTELVAKRYTRSSVVIEERQDSTTAVAERSSAAALIQGRTGVLLAIAVASILAVAAVYVWSSKRAIATPPGGPVRSMAVLPFKPITADSGDDYLGLGIADALISKLGGIKRIVVRPTNSVYKYRILGQDPTVAGRELGVDAVLDGSLQRSGENIRITAELISVRSGATFWTGTFDGRLGDIFAIQDRVSEQAARAVLVNPTGEERRQLARHYTESTEAYQAYLKGRYFWNKRDAEDFQKAVEYFQQAIEADSSYALAYAGLADCYSFLGDAQKAKSAATRALAIDDTLAEAHTSLANISLFHDWSWADAEKEFARAMELDPNYATARHWYAYYLTAMGRTDEAIVEIKHAQELDPVSVPINADVGQILYFGRKYDEATLQLQKTIKMDPGFINTYLFLIPTYLRKGMYTEAFAEYQKLQQIAPGNRLTVQLVHIYAASGRRMEAIDGLRELARAGPSDTPYDTATVYALLGDKNNAFEWLKTGLEHRDADMIFLKADPLADNLRGDARFQAVLASLNLPQ